MPNASTYPDSLVIPSKDKALKALTASEERFAGLCANGRTQSDAYRQTWATKIKNVDVVSSEVAKRPHVRRRINELREEIAEANVLDGRERREMLATIARTPVTRFVGVDLGNKRAVKRLGRDVLALKKVRVRTGEDGGTVTDFETHDRIAALREDAILAGERRTDGETSVNVGMAFTGILGALGGETGQNQGAAGVKVTSARSAELAPAQEADAHAHAREGAAVASLPALAALPTLTGAQTASKVPRDALGVPAGAVPIPED